MNTVTSHAQTRRPFGRTPGLRTDGLRAVPAAIRQRGRELRQVGTFAAIGVVSTLAYVALYALLRPVVSAETANVIALVATAIGNTAANRRLTFSVRGRAGLARDHAAGLIALGAALVITSASLAVLNVVAPGAPHAIEVAILVAANAAATLVRFLLLRLALDRSRPRGPATAQPGPVTAGRMLEGTVR
jgi:putative flippase GtrA